MVKLLSWLAAASLLVGCSYANGEEKLEQKIEREIRKQDSWVEGYVKSDYTITNKQGHLTLVRYPRKFLDINAKLGSVEFSAAYNHKSDNLLLPESTNDVRTALTIASISHELWHSLDDSTGEKGLCYLSEYIGPSLEERTLFCRQKTSGEGFAKLREQLKVRSEVERFKIDTEGFLMKVGHNLVRAINNYEESKKIIKEMRAEEVVVPEEEAKELKKNEAKIIEEFNDVKQGYKDIIVWANSRTISTNNDATLGQIRGIFEEYKSRMEGVRSYESLPKKVVEYKLLVKNTYKKARDKKVKAEIDKAREAGQMGLVKAYEEMEEARKSLDGVDEIGASMESLSLSFASALQVVTSGDNLIKIDSIINDPNEVMARVVDSLYNLYYGSVVQNNFSLTEQDLEFLGRFKVMQKGKEVQLFRKGIEKYRLGLEMIADGEKPADVKKSLEYATKYDYKGKHYSWPESNFTIKGVIPEMEYPK